MKIRKILLWSGIIMFLAAFFILNSNKILAASTEYGEHYEVKKWRYLRVVNPSDRTGIFTNWLILGPAEWEIGGHYGSDQFTEGWTVEEEDWNDGDQVIEDAHPGKGMGSNAKYEYTTNDSLAQQDFNEAQNFDGWGSDNVNSSGDYRRIVAMATGLYGAWIYIANDKFMEKDMFSTAHSWPTKWTITGTYTTP